MLNNEHSPELSRVIRKNHSKSEKQTEKSILKTQTTIGIQNLKKHAIIKSALLESSLLIDCFVKVH